MILTSWLNRRRFRRYLCLFLCSPFLLPLFCATCPIICVVCYRCCDRSSGNRGEIQGEGDGRDNVRERKGDEDVEVVDSRSPSSAMIEEIQRERMDKWEWVTVHWVNQVILEGSGHWVKNRE
ncbi:hypothetical protein H5410_053214 [Solanum commersonii]|uniref:Transmembrane protein n=1 Tax=Solanum commersonii TaxID=4109 RepID=A0A9J5X386_SOLCO|nr:hypothetical protein H5410_053214 [Solanum commersonii]